MIRLGRIRRVMVAASVLALVAAGCGGGTAETASPSSTSSATGTIETTSTATSLVTTTAVPSTLELTFTDPILVGTLSGHVADVAVSESQIVAVGSGGVVESGEQDFVLVVYRGSDPGSLTEQLDPVPSPGVVGMTDVVATGSELIAVGYGWDQSRGSTAGRMWRSPDGVTWLEVDSSSFSGVEQLSDVEATDAGFLIAGWSQDDASDLWTSPDGLDWSRVETTGDDLRRVVAVATHGTQRVAVGSSSGRAAVWISEDGASWDSVWSEAAAETHMHDVALFADWLVAVGYRGAFPPDKHPAAWVSRDGIDWERIDVMQPGAEFFGLSVRGDGLIVVGTAYQTAVDDAAPDCQPCPTVWEAEVP